MLEDHAKVLRILKHAGEVTGRKKLQKMVFILKKLNYPFREKYEFHFYGPYSEELTLQIEELSNLNLVEEIKEDRGNYHQYRYQLTDHGEHFLDNFKFDIPNLEGLVHFLNNQSSRFLELVSTALYFDHLEETETREKVKVVKAKLKFSEEELDQAFEFIKALRTQKAHGTQLVH